MNPRLQQAIELQSDLPPRSAVSPALKNLFEKTSSVIAGAIAWALSISLLTVSPQSGDASEQITVALSGGVLHPPGFPLQAWMNQFFISLPWGTPCLRLAFYNSIGHGVLVFAVAETVRRLGCGILPSLIAAAAAGCFPSVWFLGVHLETFSWAYALFALLILESVEFTVRPERRHGTRDAFLLGATIALAGAQHTITVIAAPAFITAAVALLVPAKTRVQRFLALAVSFSLLFGGLYGSLLLLKTQGVWPTWGPMNDIHDVIHHLLRVDYGVFRLLAPVAPESANGLYLFAHDALVNWNWLLFLIVIGAAASLAKISKLPMSTRIALGGTVALSLFFLFNTVFYGPELYREGFVERFQGTAVIPLAIIIGLGAQFLALSSREKIPPFLLALGAGLVVVTLHVHNRSAADGSRPGTLDVLRPAVGLEVPADAIYVSSADEENFYGFTIGNSVRFPIENGMFRSPWYRANIIPMQEPRVADWPKGGVVNSLAPIAYSKGIAMASTDMSLLTLEGSPTPEFRGLVFVLAPSLHEMYTRRTYDEVVALCPFARLLESLPNKPLYFERARYGFVARAFFGASKYAESVGDTAGVQILNSIWSSLQSANDADIWRSQCSALKEHWWAGLHKPPRVKP